MKCFTALTYSIHIDGELPPGEAAAVEKHIGACADCHQLVRALQEEALLLASVLQEDAVEAPVSAPALTLRELGWTAAWILAGVTGVEAVWRRLSGLNAVQEASWFNPFAREGQWTLVFSGSYFLVDEGAAMLFSLAKVAGLLAAAALMIAAAYVLLRRPRAVVGLVGAMLALGISLPAQAIDVRKGDSVVIPQGETLDDTLIARGATVAIDGVVTGNVFAFGERVSITGTVRGDVFSFARSLEIEGTVEGNVFSWTQSVMLRGVVKQSWYSFAGGVTLFPSGRVDGDVLAYTSRIDLDGTVGRDVVAGAGQVSARGAVGRHLKVYTKRLSLLAPARIGGDIRGRVESERRLQIEPGAQIAGQNELTFLDARPSRYGRLGFYYDRALRLAAAFLTGWLLLWLFPTLFRYQSASGLSLLKTLGVGFLAVVATPVAALLAGLTLVGIPVSVLVVALLATAIYLAKIAAGCFLGNMLLQGSTAAGKRGVLPLLAGLAIIYVAISLPWVGFWLHMLLIVLGVGMLTQRATALWREARAA